ncbi:MAG TPA: hypothetical protein VEX70_14870 [Pyrinomonadaceae bacterium]|jgi:hypothetical protein|nr:hypothetical protein [Pyrinomonadaceae bacterium]
MNLKTTLKIFTALMAFGVAAFFAMPLKYSDAFGARGCIRLAEDVAIFCVLVVMLSLGVAFAGIASLIPSMRDYVWRIALGSLAACLMFGLGLLLA